jgi:thioredoxin reductase/SAM-dependent methyltransferase
MTDETTYDVVVIGGGAAGLSGATALARARRSVLVIDDGQPRNAPAGHVHNYLGADGTPPAALLATGRDEVARYGGGFLDGQAEDAVRDGDGFMVTVAGDRRVRARRLLVTTGLVDELPDLPGLAGRWGRDVLHCPYCHGWEVRDRRIGVLATGPLAVHQAEMWRQWSPQVLLLRHIAGAPTAEEAERLAARAIPVVDGLVEALEVDGDRLAGVRLASGEAVALDALVVGSRLVARAGVLGSLGLVAEPLEMGGYVIATQIPADADGATSVAGVWVAGNVADARAQVITAAAGGLRAAVAINMDLMAEETRAAVEAHRLAAATMFEEPAWEERYQARPAVWSGQPNAQLVAEAADLPAGRALDVGCGEGADAIWLAGRGWQVDAVDISATALQRAASVAAAQGSEIAGRIEFAKADLRVQPPAPGGYDLVTAHFMHLPEQERRELFARLAEAVAPGGVLLIVGHHPSDLHTPGVRRMHFPQMMYTAEDLAADLDQAEWHIEAAQKRPRAVTGPDGAEAVIHDAVLRARRT